MAPRTSRPLFNSSRVQSPNAAKARAAPEKTLYTFLLDEVVHQANVLLLSSDLSRVKVTRHGVEMQYDLTLEARTGRRWRRVAAAAVAAAAVAVGAPGIRRWNRIQQQSPRSLAARRRHHRNPRTRSQRAPGEIALRFHVLVAAVCDRRIFPREEVRRSQSAATVVR